jgi:Flp pilus assembly protein TadD
MAYYTGLLEGNAALVTTAYGQLSAIKKQLSGDRDALDALGVLSAQQGDLSQATDLFKQVLAMDRDNLIASTNLGTLMAKKGNFGQAIELWSPIYQNNQDFIGLAKNLARVKCAMGDIAETRTVLVQALQYSPGSTDVRHMLDSLPSCESH